MVSQKRILLAIDDALLCDILVDQFTMHAAVPIETAIDVKSALEKIGQDTVLAIFDNSLVSERSTMVCQAIRQKGFQLPVIILTKTQIPDVSSLDVGEVDYIVKPFKFSTLLAKVQWYLRRHTQYSTKVTVRLGSYEFRPVAKMLVTAEGQRIKLTQKETNILTFLYKAEGQRVERSTLLNEVWGYNSGVETHTLETHIYRLRQKIEPDKSCATILLTDGGGYKLSKYALGNIV